MNRVITIVVILLAAYLGASPASKQPKIDVRGPTVIAFFPPVTQSELTKDTTGTNEALDDFQFYAAKVREPLSKAGIAFHEVYARSFRVADGRRSTVFRPSKIEVGYYLVLPGKDPRVQYEVMTDTDLLQIAREYFGFPKNNEKQPHKETNR